MCDGVCVGSPHPGHQCGSLGQGAVAGERESSWVVIDGGTEGLWDWAGLPVVYNAGLIRDESEGAVQAGQAPVTWGRQAGELMVCHSPGPGDTRHPGCAGPGRGQPPGDTPVFVRGVSR